MADIEHEAADALQALMAERDEARAEGDTWKEAFYGAKDEREKAFLDVGRLESALAAEVQGRKAAEKRAELHRPVMNAQLERIQTLEAENAKLKARVAELVETPDTDMDWRIGEGGYKRVLTVYEVSDYDGGDPALELAEKRDGTFDLIITKGGEDITLWSISPLFIDKIGQIFRRAASLLQQEDAQP